MQYHDDNEYDDSAGLASPPFSDDGTDDGDRPSDDGAPDIASSAIATDSGDAEDEYAVEGGAAAAAAGDGEEDVADADAGEDTGEDTDADEDAGEGEGEDADADEDADAGAAADADAADAADAFVVRAALHDAFELNSPELPALSDDVWRRVLASAKRRVQGVHRAYADAMPRLLPSQLQAVIFGLVKFLLADEIGQAAADRLGFVSGFLLADDMGLGKTRTMVALALALSRRFDEADGGVATNNHNNNNRATLIIVPGSTFDEWCTEVGRLDGDGELRLAIVRDAKGARSRSGNAASIFSPSADVVLVSAELLKQEASIRWACGCRWRAIAIDEGHSIKDGATNTAKNAARLRGDLKVLLTATPMANSDRDLANELEWVGYARDRVSTVEKLTQLIPLCMLQRTFEDVGLTRTRMNYVIYKVPPEPELQQILDALDRHNSRKPPMALLQIKRQVLFDAGVIYRAKPWRGWVAAHRDELPPVAAMVNRRSVLVQKLIDDLRLQPDDRKAVVFCHFTEQLVQVCKALSEEGIRNEELSGQQNENSKRLAKFSFRKGDARVLVCNIQCGGTGLNLQAGKDVYIMSTDYNPHIEMQAIARVWRMGQTSDVRTVVITSPANDVEARLQHIQYRKIVLAAEVLGARTATKLAAHVGRLEEGRQRHEAMITADSPLRPGGGGGGPSRLGARAALHRRGGGGGGGGGGGTAASSSSTASAGMKDGDGHGDDSDSDSDDARIVASPPGSGTKRRGGARPVEAAATTAEPSSGLRKRANLGGIRPTPV